MNLISWLLNPCGCLCQMWENSLEVFLSYCVHKNGTNIWTIGQEGILMPLAMATAGIKKKKKKYCRYRCKKNKNIFLHFMILFICSHVTIQQWILHYQTSDQVKRHHKSCLTKQSWWYYEENSKKEFFWGSNNLMLLTIFIQGQGCKIFLHLLI